MEKGRLNLPPRLPLAEREGYSARRLTRMPMPSTLEAETLTEDDCSSGERPLTDLQYNLRVESIFSAFNGVFMGMIFFGAPIIAYACLDATPLQLAMMTAAFPCG